MHYLMPFFSCFKVWSNFMLYLIPFSRFLIQYFFYGHRKSIPMLKIYIFQTQKTQYGKKRTQNRTRIFQWRYFRKWRIRYVWNHHPMWCNWQQLLLQFHEIFQCIHGDFVFRFHSLPNQSYFFQKRFFVFFFFSLDKTSWILFVFVFYLLKNTKQPWILILMPTIYRNSINLFTNFSTSATFGFTISVFCNAATFIFSGFTSLSSFSRGHFLYIYSHTIFSYPHILIPFLSKKQRQKQNPKPNT